LIGDLAMPARAGELVDGLAIPVEPQPFEAAQDRGDGLGRGALAVGVLDAQQERAARVTGEKPVEQGRSRAADMQESGG